MIMIYWYIWSNDNDLMVLWWYIHCLIIPNNKIYLIHLRYLIQVTANKWIHEFLLSKHLWSFLKSHNTPYCLLAMFEKWKSIIDDKKKIWSISVTDSSKAFECLSYELLLTKLHVYGFNITALRFWFRVQLLKIE